MGNVIQIKRGSTVPADGTLADGELGYNKTDGFLYIGVDNKSVKIKAEGSGGSSGTISGILSLAQGGTGADLSEATTDALIVKSSDKLEARIPTTGTGGGGAVFYNEKGVLNFGLLPLSKGGTGANLKDIPAYSVIIKDPTENSDNLSFIAPPGNSAILVYDSGASNTTQGTKFISSLPLALGGTGTTFSGVDTNAIIVKGSGNTLSAKYPTVTGAGTNGGGAVYYTEQGTLIINTLPISKGGTGANLSGTDVVANSIIVKGSGSALSYVAPSSGAFYYDGSSLIFGTLPLTHGGTGSTTGLQGAHRNAVIIKHTSESALSSVSSTKGAFYSTGQNNTPVFGILPVSIGGTGADLSGTDVPADSIIIKGSDDTLSAKVPGNGAVFYTQSGTLSIGTLPISKGGTGATNIESARSNLGFGKELATINLTVNTTSSNITDDISKYTFLLVQIDHANWTTMPQAFFLSPYALTSTEKVLQFQATHKDNGVFIGTVGVKKDSSKITFTRKDTSVRIIVYGII